MKAHEVFQSDYLKAADLSDGGDDYVSKVLTITAIETSKPFDDGNTQRLLSFKEMDKKLGLNKTNWNKIASLTKQDDDENWVGAKIEIWVDPDVQYGGKTVPGIRIRKVPGSNNPTTSDLKAAGVKPASELGLATKATAWAAWKRAPGRSGSEQDKLDFKKACEIESANSKTPIENFGAVQWANVAEAHTVLIDESEIPF